MRLPFGKIWQLDETNVLAQSYIIYKLQHHIIIFKLQHILVGTGEEKLQLSVSYSAEHQFNSLYK